MKFCIHCGAQIMNEAVICIHCGCPVRSAVSAAPQKDDTMETVVKVFLILGCISMGWAIIPL
ncbi:MAG: zinc-ribbon domain-containing protein, partial [Clostridia bacterium]|nr:zinc-ribbon domain-containing protein [Clostridia bacterium]